MLTLREKIRARLRRGNTLCGLMPAYRFYRAWSKPLARFFLLSNLACYGCGYRLTCRLIAPFIMPRPTGARAGDGPLYHLTYAHMAQTLLQAGLRSQYGCVFLTDHLSYAESYYPWKNALLSHKAPGARLERAVLRVDAERLQSMGHKIIALERANEFVTDFVPRECLRLYPQADRAR